MTADYPVLLYNFEAGRANGTRTIGSSLQRIPGSSLSANANIADTWRSEVRSVGAIICTALALYDLFLGDKSLVGQDATLALLFYMWLDLNGKIKGMK